MRVFWRVFWFLRLGVAAYLTYRCIAAWNDQAQLLQELTVISIWTMWTSDLPDGKEEGGKNA